MFDISFWSNSLANLIATIIGIGIGLPIAFWIDRVARRRNDADKTKEAHQRGLKILTLLKFELEGNLTSVDEFHEDLSNYYHPVACQSWLAFSDGGELQWINDPQIVYELSTVYSQINDYRFLLEKYFDAYFFPGSMGNPNMKKPLLQNLLNCREIAIPMIKVTIKLLAEKISYLANGAS